MSRASSRVQARTLGQKADFLFAEYKHLCQGRVLRTRDGILYAENVAMARWNLDSSVPRECDLFYSVPRATILANEKVFFGCDFMSINDKDLEMYRLTLMKELGIENNLKGLGEYGVHIKQHIDRDYCEALYDYHQQDTRLCGPGDFILANRAWAGRSRVMECELMRFSLSVCVQCQEIRHGTTFKHDKCDYCRLIEVTKKRKHSAAAAGESSNSDSEEEVAEDIVGRYSEENKAIPPTRHPLYAKLSLVEQAVLSPILPYIRVTDEKHNSRGKSFGHVFIISQDVVKICQVLPRLPSEVDIVSIVNPNSGSTEVMSVPRMVLAMYTLSQDPVMAAILSLHGIQLDGMETHSRVQEWHQAEGQIPECISMAPRENENMEEECAPGQGVLLEEDEESEDDEEEEEGGLIANLQPAVEEGGSAAGCREFFIAQRGVVTDKADGIGDAMDAEHSVDQIAWPAAVNNLFISDTYPDLWNLSFPFLCFGEADFNHSLSGREVGFDSRARWLQHLVNSVHSRFASHKIFVFIAQNWVMRRETAVTATVMAKQCTKVATMTKEELMADLQKKDSSALNAIFAFGKTITGSVAYWRHVRSQLSHFLEWKWFSKCNDANDQNLHFCEKIVDNIRLEREETDLLDDNNDETEVRTAAYSEREYADTCHHVIDTPSAFVFFECSDAALLRILLCDDYGDDWTAHTIKSVLQFRSSSRNLPLNIRARAAYVLSRVVFYERMVNDFPEVAQYFRLKWVPIFSSEHWWAECDMERYVDGNNMDGDEVEVVDNDSMFLKHEINFANSFLQSTNHSKAACQPSFFLTGSMAEHHWPELWTLMESYVQLVRDKDPGDEWLWRVAETGLKSPADRSQALKKFPHISTTFFRLRTELCYKIVLVPILGLDDYFIKYEFAEGRGEIHFHALGWSAHPKLTTMHDLGFQAGVIQFARVWLQLNANHPSAMKEERCHHPNFNPNGVKPHTYGKHHPCKQFFSTIPAREVREWDIKMCNCCCTHSCVNNFYCLRKKGHKTKMKEGITPGTPGDMCHKCRFDYHLNKWSGKALVSVGQAGIRTSKAGKQELVMERNDSFVLQHSKFFRRCWRGNCDVQMIVILDPVIIQDYVVKYVTKEEYSSKEFQEFFKNVCCDDNVQRTSLVLRKMMMYMLGHRDKPAQEVLYAAAGNKYYQFSRQSGTTINLSDFRKVTTSTVTGSINLLKTVVDKYEMHSAGAGRNGLSLYEYACEVNPEKSVNIGGTVYYVWPVTEAMCKMLLLLHHPWEAKFDVLKCSKTGSVYNTFAAKFLGDFLYTPRCPLLIFQNLMYKRDQRDNPWKFTRVQPYSVASHGRGNIASFLKYFGYRSVFTDLKASHDGDVNYSQAPPGYDWSQTTLGEDKLRELSLLAKYDDKEREGVPRLKGLKLREPTILNNKQQQFVISFGLQHCLDCCNGNIRQEKVQCLGGGGTGKSHVLKILRAGWNAMLRDDNATLVITPTAAAATVIDGCTIHSAMGWKIDLKDVNSDRMKEVEAMIKAAKFLIIDEKSMLPQKLLHLIEDRFNQFRGCASNGRWGGLWGIYMFGDDGQLAPTAGQPLFDKRAKEGESLRGYQLYREFNTVFELTQLVRQDANEEEFKEILQGVKKGELSDEALQLLNKRSIGCLTAEVRQRFEGRAGIHFVPYNVERIEANVRHIGLAPGPVAQFKSMDCGNAKHLNAYDSASLLQGLQPILWLGKGVKVAVICNLCVPKKVAKGRTGVVTDVIYQDGCCPPSLPRLVLVKMDTANVNALQGIVPGAGNEDVLPFAPIRRQCEHKCCSRTMLPLDVCGALTVHRCQGTTVVCDTVVSLSAKAEVQFPGITYTALSRFKRMASFALLTVLNRDIIVACKRSLISSGRMAEMQRLATLRDETSRLFGHVSNRFSQLVDRFLHEEDVFLT